MNPTLTVITGVCGAIDITRQWCQETLARTATKHEVVVVSNGNTDKENVELEKMFKETGWKYKIYKSDIPLGSTITYNVGATLATGDIIAMVHNDLMVKDSEWDMKLIMFFQMISKQRLGIVGVHGSRRLGHPLIYKIPYELPQLARGDNYSNMEDAESHGTRCASPMQVATLDGMFLACWREFFEQLGGFDEQMIHHMYDHDLCMKSHYAGHANFMLPLVVRHLNGQTANAERYNNHYERIGRDQGIHTRSHAYFYEKYRNRLPVVV